MEPLVAQLKASSSASTKVTVLRCMKNIVIGHQDKKSLATDDFLQSLIDACTHVEAGKRRSPARVDINASLSTEESVRLEAIYIIGSLSRDGITLSKDLLATSTLSALLSNLCPQSNTPTVILAALRALSALAYTSTIITPCDTTPIEAFSSLFFSRPHISSLNSLLNQSDISAVIENQISLVASLLVLLCRTELHRKVSVDEGIMEGLARTLARAIADQGAALPGRHFREEMMAEQHEQNLEYHGRSDVYLILRALVVIVGSSSARARRLNNSSIIINTFNANWASKLSSNAISVGCLIPKAPRLIARLRELRQPPPHLHIQHPYVDPALLQNHPYKSGRYLDDAEEVGQNDEESPLIPYLIWLCRSDRSVERLAAAQLLAVLFKTGILDPGRQTDIGLIVIPIIAQQLLDFGGLNQKDAEGFFLMEEAPSILAKLMVDSEYLQKAAYDAGAVSSLFAILKYSYDPISPNLASWTPVNRDSPKMNSSDVEADRIGERIASLLHHCLKIRENVLKAIASCTPLKEEYRKSLVEQGITPLIVESLKPTLDKPLVDVADKRRSAKAEDLRSLSELNQSAISNSASALVAACSTVKHLARSPSLLRTALVDHGVVVPIFNLLGHPETEIQIAATAATINLVSELSPMREELLALGVLEVLCQHAHSGNAEMQCNALWALKHLVQASSTDVKRQCWKELGQQWLIDAISMSHEGCRSTHDADGDSRMEASDDDAAMGVECSDASENDLCEYEREEVDKARSSLPKFRKDRFSVLEQSLGFLRNLIGGYTSSSNCNNSEMIDLLFREWGEDQLFTILESKLEPRVETTGFTGARQAFNNAGPVIFPETEIIVSVQYILVNIAASIPQHREAIMRRKALLELLLTHFSHPRSEVRLSLCWLITNLVYVDSDVDEYGQLGRVRELAKLGYASKLDSLLTDVNVDVRERAKTALHYMRSHVV